MKNEYLIKPYLSVGQIEFGMSREEVERLFDVPPDRVAKSFTGKTGLYWNNISVKINTLNKMDEISFLSGGTYNIVLNDINLFEDVEVKKKLDSIEIPFVNRGFEVYFSLGISTTGFSNKEEESNEKTVSIFSKELIPAWKD
jgi:hypothetical protein